MLHQGVRGAVGWSTPEYPEIIQFDTQCLSLDLRPLRYMLLPNTIGQAVSCINRRIATFTPGRSIPGLSCHLVGEVNNWQPGQATTVRVATRKSMLPTSTGSATWCCTSMKPASFRKNAPKVPAA